MHYFQTVHVQCLPVGRAHDALVSVWYCPIIQFGMMRVEHAEILVWEI